jgi:deoxyribose-phosphate aldolase
MKSYKKQVGGKHYKNYKIQPVEFIIKNNIGFVEGNIIKYVLRFKEKGGVQDLEKAKHYIELLIDSTKSR